MKWATSHVFFLFLAVFWYIQFCCFVWAVPWYIQLVLVCATVFCVFWYMYSCYCVLVCTTAFCAAVYTNAFCVLWCMHSCCCVLVCTTVFCALVYTNVFVCSGMCIIVDVFWYVQLFVVLWYILLFFVFWYIQLLFVEGHIPDIMIRATSHLGWPQKGPLKSLNKNILNQGKLIKHFNILQTSAKRIKQYTTSYEHYKQTPYRQRCKTHIKQNSL